MSDKTPNPSTIVEGVPPRRQGRQCGYPGKEELDAANRRLRRALSALARDEDPQARLIGARVAAEAEETLSRLATLADESSTKVRRIRENAQRMMAWRAPILEQARANAAHRNTHG